MSITKDKWWYQEDLIQKSISEDNCKEHDIPLSKYKHLSVYGTYPGGTFVAYCGCHKETEANARFIAAAPETKQQRDDLLAALQKISQGHPDGNPIFLIKIAKEAIAKAEGE